MSAFVGIWRSKFSLFPTYVHTVFVLCSLLWCYVLTLEVSSGLYIHPVLNITTSKSVKKSTSDCIQLSSLGQESILCPIRTLTFSWHSRDGSWLSYGLDNRGNAVRNQVEGRSTPLKSLDGLWETPSFPQREVKRPKVKLIVPIYNRDKEWVEICFHSPILLRGVHGDNFASHLACVKIAVNKSSPLQPGCTQVPFYTGSWISGLQILMTVKSYR